MSTIAWLLPYVSGVLTWPLIERLFGFAFAELRQRRASVAAARRIVSEELDPLLKAADELHGKLRSLAEEDFQDFRRLSSTDLSVGQTVDLCSTMFLFAHFWARLEILRRESFHAELSATPQGALLLSFLRSLESRRVRLVDRAWQRLIAESVVTGDSTPYGTSRFTTFVERYEGGGATKKWLQPLEEILRDTGRGLKRDQQRARQRLLQYGVIIHALVDTLDAKHRTTRARPGYPNKLTRRAKRELIGRVFGEYLPGVSRKNVEKYTGIPR